MAKKNPYGAVDVQEPAAGLTAAEAASAATAKKDKAADAKIFTADKKLPTDLTEPTKDTKPKGFAIGGGVSATRVGSPVMMDRMPVMRPGAAPIAGRRQLPVRPAMGSRMASGGSVGSASRRADGIASKGKTKGKMV